MDRIKSRGIQIAEATLHIGLDTFAPVHEEDPREHKIHQEWCRLPQETADLINRTKESGGRVIAVGTTSVRTIETAARVSGQKEKILPFEGKTDPYIFHVAADRNGRVDASKRVEGAPGSAVLAIDLPESTLLMMVSAFAGREKILELYQLAIDEEYRFYSFGDAMLLV